MSAPSSWQKFRIEQFGGLVSGPARGTANPLSFRQLEGWTHGVMPGALSIDRPRLAFLTITQATRRAISIWYDGRTTLPRQVFAQAADGTIYTGNTRGGSITPITASTSADARPMRQLESMLLAFCYGPTTSALADAFGVQFLNFAASPASNEQLNTAFSTVTATAGGILPVGGWQGLLIPAADVHGRGFVLARSHNGSSFPVSTTAGNQSITIAYGAGLGSFRHFLLTLKDTGPNGLYYSYGIVGPQAGTDSLVIDGLPLDTAASYYGTELYSRVQGDLIVRRLDRTFVAGNAKRDYYHDLTFVTRAQSDVPDPDRERTVYYSEAGFPWAFPPENFFTLGIEGAITALAKLGDRLLVFSAAEVYAVSGNDGGSFAAARLDSAKPGALSQEGVVEWRDSVYYVGYGGVFRLGADGSSQRISDAIKDQFLGLADDVVTGAAVDFVRGILYFQVGASVFSFDPDSGAWAKLAGSFDCVASGAMLSSTSGTTYYVHDGTAVTTAILQTEYLDLGAPDVTKSFRRVSAAFDNPTDAAGSCVLTPVRADGTDATALAAQVIPVGRSVLTFNLPGPALVGRGIAVRLAVTGKPGLTLQAPIEIEYRPLAGRRR